MWKMWQYYKDIHNNVDFVEFNGAHATDSFNVISNITGQTGDNGTKEVEILIPLKYLINFWRTFEIHLINCEINLILSWNANWVIVYINVANQGATFAITET